MLIEKVNYGGSNSLVVSHMDFVDGDLTVR